MADLLVVSSKVKERVKEISGDKSVASDVAEKLSQKVDALIREAVERSTANGRQTVMAKDV
jgi:histone H3/H4